MLIQPDTVETDYIYERPEEGHYRVTTMGEGTLQRVINAGMKTRRTDIMLNDLQTDLHYVVRLSISTESEDEEKPDKVANNWSTNRRKIRSTFTNTGTVPLPPTTTSSPSDTVVIPWRIDLTRVETTRAMRIDSVQLDPPMVTFEVELEMPPLSEDPHIGLKTKVVACNDGVSLLMCALSYACRNSEGPIRWTPPSNASQPHPPSQSPLRASHPPHSQAPQALHPSSYSLLHVTHPSLALPLQPSYSAFNVQHPQHPPPPPHHLPPHHHTQPPRKEAPHRKPIDPKRHPDFPSLLFERVSNIQPLRAAFERCFKDHPQFENSHRFLGTMPINFARRHLHLIRSKPYWVSEKTDGVRFMLFISHSGGSSSSHPTSQSPSLSSSSSSIGTTAASSTSPSLFVIDRSNNFFRVPQLQHFASLLSPNSDTLLDGELVRRHQDEESYYFLVFDAITVDGHAVWNLPMEQRLSRISNVVDQFRSFSAQASPSDTFPFAIYAKEIVPKERFHMVRQNVHMEPNGESVYRSSSLCHLTDGLIFMPECFYPLYTCPSMYKWKFVDRQTIDFEVTFPSSSSSSSYSFESPSPAPTPQNTLIELHIGGNAGSTVLTRTVSLVPEDLDKLKLDIAHSLRPNLVIAEMGFDTHTGYWRYHKLRPDKDKPNYISIALDTMESIAENINLEEMESILQSRYGTV